MSTPNPPAIRPRRSALGWQSKAVLLAFVPLAGTWAFLEISQLWPDPVLWEAIGISLGFATLVYLLRAATLGAATTGAIFTVALYLETPGLRTALWPLLALFLLTFIATRFGRRRKETLGIAEARRGRTASQVAANLGVAALCGVPISALHVFSPTTFSRRAALIAMLAAMAEATADTVSSELGQVLGGIPRMITSFKRVPAGTDGAISLAGTFSGLLAAALVVALGVEVLGLSHLDGLIALAAGLIGTLIDSLLGAIPERKGWLNNDAVNALSTLAAAVVGAWSTHWL